jgi:hypothetical protein
LDLSASHYKWVQVESPNDPGPLTRHSSFVYEDDLYLQGGFQGANRQSNRTWRFNIPTQVWTQLECGETYPTGYDNHSSTLVDGGAIIFGGYFSGELSD